MAKRRRRASSRSAEVQEEYERHEKLQHYRKLAKQEKETREKLGKVVDEWWELRGVKLLHFRKKASGNVYSSYEGKTSGKGGPPVQQRVKMLKKKGLLRVAV